MAAKSDIAHGIHNPLAIFDKELVSTPSFTLQTFELCTMCGARFGIGYQGTGDNDAPATYELEELPRKLTEILARDHLQNRAHRRFIELDI